ncbi:TetR/AcrR family transcriptional regulator C-terminal domain-containing protein [Pseudonocardia yunnanensis]|uniref:TetR/AcrR family transcriptional regulator C-terminal domain-containing protein n=1 Tax=Pseudonocardia yunnanensis TaxID=58107 RepID=A0ABW4EQS4_9PSEU
MPPAAEPPYQRIATAIRERIRAGELRPGDRVPSTRAIVQEWGVAMVTAAKALGVLQQEGLVEARPGMGTVVRASEQTRTPHRPGGRPPALTRNRIVAAAIAIADAEGIEALSMRHLSAELGVGPMTLYRYFASKDELVHGMVRELMAARPLPASGPGHWRAALELVCRLQWDLYRTHHWLAGVMSMTRPLLLPEAMAHSEWVLGALDGLGLSPEEMAREAITLPAFVRGTALTMSAEAEAERESGMTNLQWWLAIDHEVQEQLGSGRFPHLATMAPGVVDDLDGLFEHGLARHLDGLAARLAAVP